MKPDTRLKNGWASNRMLPLIFRMAMPAVAAQLVNLLYTLATVFTLVTYLVSEPMHWPV